MSGRTIHPVDKHVGERLRTQRMLVGMSQTQLASSVGLTFQQIQKYEKGVNRVSASKLYDFSKVFEVPFDFFLSGFKGEDVKPSYATAGMSDGGQNSFEGQKLEVEDLMTRRETIKLVRAYYNIEDEKTRKQIFAMVKTMGSNNK